MEQMDKTDALHRKNARNRFSKTMERESEGKEKMKERQL